MHGSGATEFNDAGLEHLQLKNPNGPFDFGRVGKVFAPRAALRKVDSVRLVFKGRVLAARSAETSGLKGCVEIGSLERSGAAEALRMFVAPPNKSVKAAAWM
eukprot:14039696-Alexandrium_andersonii.AAC.1